jgi:hypothetical protein
MEGVLGMLSPLVTRNMLRARRKCHSFVQMTDGMKVKQPKVSLEAIEAKLREMMKQVAKI